MKKSPAPFTCMLTRTERIVGAFLLPVHVFVLPLLLSMLAEYWPSGIPDGKLNTIYYFITFLLVFFFLRRGLLREWNRFCDHSLPCLILLLPTHLLCLLLSVATALVCVLLLPDTVSALYDAALPQTLVQHGGGMFTALVLLAPFAEEPLFRGVIFGSLRKKSRFAAYAVTVLAYAVYAVWQYAVMQPDLSVLFYALQEIPAAVALCWCYEKTGTLFMPMLYHALSNLLPALVLSSGLF